VIGLVDIHHHLIPPGYIKALGKRMGHQGITGKTPDWTPDVSLAAMDRHGIAASLLSVSSPGVALGDIGETRDLARACNECAAETMRAHPTRFGFLAALPLPDVAASLAEITYAFDRLGADGVCLMTHSDGVYPGEEGLAPVFDELDRREAVVFIHPTASPGWTALPEIPWPTLEFPFDTTRAVVSLMMGGTLHRCRRIRWIFAHAAGAVPFLAERIARLNAIPKFRQNVPDGVPATLARIHADTALSANALAFSCLRQVIPLDRVMFGSDYPHAGEPTLAASVTGLDGLELSVATRDAIARGTALKLFPALAARMKRVAA
jgi:aminocarboxymuconate-semialdehyde decarboxylase